MPQHKPNPLATTTAGVVVTIIIIVTDAVALPGVPVVGVVVGVIAFGSGFCSRAATTLHAHQKVGLGAGGCMVNLFR